VESYAILLGEATVLYYVQARFPDIGAAPTKGSQQLDAWWHRRDTYPTLVPRMGIAAGRYMPLGHSLWRW
jgi:hypothetical protein